VSGLDPAIAGKLTRNTDGLVCAVVQQRGTGEVMMVAWMDDEALHRTLSTGRATYWSRSRQVYWVKGETSGHTQHVHEVRLDCDGDALLLHRLTDLLRRGAAAQPVSGDTSDDSLTGLRSGTAAG
jgi:phosphoribosyl-AMP cyclohydrolase